MSGEDASVVGRHEVSQRRELAQARSWVVKIGSALITADGRGLDRARIAGWAAAVADLRGRGHDVVIVSSGAVAEGCVRLGVPRPETVHGQQAVAAVGQMGLIGAWETALAGHGLHTALVLLTHEDLRDRRRYLNARSTLRTLVSMGVVPVINENDTVATDEIRFGDNDTLAALVGNLVEADLLVLLTDQRGLHESDPRGNPDAPLVEVASADDERLDAMVAGGGGALGRGGMRTKVRAARVAARSGAATLIADGREPDTLAAIHAGRAIGTLLLPAQGRMASRKRWIAGQLQTRGVLVVDDGAARVLREQGRSLLAVGVVDVHGDFARGDVVLCRDRNGNEIARGLVNYSARETRRIRGCNSEQLEARLGYRAEPELVHRDNLVLA